jgi:SAM-dependent methyltransferase
MDPANQEQAEHWNSEQAAAHWITHQARYDRMHEPFATMIIREAAVSTGDRVLDVGCGCGATTRAAAALATTGEAVGIDLSAPMLARARADAQSVGPANASFIEGDAQVHPFEPGSFDIVISRFGVMFFDDPAAAFTNLYTATKPGGRLVFVCWQPLAANQWLLVPGSALAEHVPLADPGSPNAPGMFALADPSRVRGILASAGWRDIQITPMQTPILVGGGGTVDDAVEFLLTGSLGRSVLVGADPATKARAVASVHAALAPYADDEGVHLGAAVWLVRARL